MSLNTSYGTPELDALDVSVWDSLLDIDSVSLPLSTHGKSTQPANSLSTLPPSRLSNTHRRRTGRQYLGCATCRRRKIKCDGTRPVCCNCEKSRRYICGGYPADRKHSGAFSERLSSESLDPDMVNSQWLHFNDNSELVQYRSYNAEDLAVNRLGFDFTPDLNLEQFNISSVANDLTLSAKSPRPGSALGFHPMVDQDLDDQSLAKYCPTHENQLLVYYRDTVCHYMMPTVDPARNPWLQVYFGLASHGKPTSFQVALQEALISVAAYHLEETDERVNTQIQCQAVSYRTRALRTLQSLLKTELEELDRVDKQSLLAATLALVSTDVFGRDHTDCTVNLHNARHVISLTGGDAFWQSDALSNVLWQIFNCYHVITSTSFVQTTVAQRASVSNLGWHTSSSAYLHNITDAGSAETAPHIPGPPSSTPSDAFYVLGLSFGIAESTFSLLGRTVVLAERCSEYTAVSTWPREIVDEVHALQREITSNNMKFDAPSDRQMAELAIPGPRRRIFVGSDTTSQQSKPACPLHPMIGDEVLRNHQECFHYALMLYFYRAFPEQPVASCSTVDTDAERRRTSEGCQDYVEKVLDCLETIESLTGGLPVKPANTLWPAFIAAVEAVDVDLRHRAFIWLSKMARRGLGNVVRAQQIAMEVWRRVDRAWSPSSESSLDERGLGRVDWRVVMAEKKLSIMLT